MNIIQAILLSIIEGLTEFLPISSTGHLILATSLLNLNNDFVKSFEIIIQFGAILAVVVLYWRKLIKNPNYWKKIAAAFIPSAGISFLLYKVVKNHLLGNSQIVVWSLLIGGIILVLFDYFHKEKNKQEASIETMSYKNAIIIGLAQTIAVIPGISRSAATIVGALALGETRATAVEFSFLLAIPTMLAAAGYDIYKEKGSFTGNEYTLLAVGLTGSFITALVAVKFFLNYVRNHDFKIFGLYRIVVSFLFFFIKG